MDIAAQRILEYNQFPHIVIYVNVIKRTVDVEAGIGCPSISTHTATSLPVISDTHKVQLVKETTAWYPPSTLL